MSLYFDGFTWSMDGKKSGFWNMDRILQKRRNQILHKTKHGSVYLSYVSAFAFFTETTKRKCCLDPDLSGKCGSRCRSGVLFSHGWQNTENPVLFWEIFDVHVSDTHLFEVLLSA